MITLNDLSLPSPSSLSVSVSPRGGTSQYNALGQLVQDGMRDKRTVEICWRHMPGDQLAELSALLNQGGFFTLVYPDPLDGKREMRCCLHKQWAQVWQYRNDVPIWAQVQLTLEEE